MSTTVCVAPIMAALVGTEDILGVGRLWKPQNQNQERIVELLKLRDQLNVFFQKTAEGELGHKELRYWVDWVAENLNKILREEGFGIQLKDFKKGEFGVVSILDVLVEWLIKGQEDEIIADGVVYPAVRMGATGRVDGQYTQLVEVFESSRHPHPVGMLRTKTGDKVYVTVAEKKGHAEWPPKDFALYLAIEYIRRDLNTSPGEWAGMIFPMVDINDRPDISWLIGMNTIDQQGNYAEVSQALQQTKFKMNQYGARVKSAVAIGVTITAVRHKPQWLIIDEPFYLWIERDGVSFPIVGMYVDPSDWKDPGDLHNM